MWDKNLSWSDNIYPELIQTEYPKLSFDLVLVKRKKKKQKRLKANQR